MHPKKTRMFLRLRQLCLVARDLEPVVDDLAAVFALQVCHRDPLVGHFGLRNAVLPIGTGFLEVVAPLTEGTAAGRRLERRAGDGGYMVILDTDELSRWRTRVAGAGVRIAADLAHGDYAGLQLHPRDVGGALLEINTMRGGADPHGPYAPAGSHWQDHVSTARVKRVAGAALQSDDPERLARRWGEILDRPVHGDGPGNWRVDVDNAVLRFIPPRDGRGEGLAEIDLEVVDMGTIQSAALSGGCRCDGNAVMIGGVRFLLSAV
jgi:hypothetical protein